MKIRVSVSLLDYNAKPIATAHSFCRQQDTDQGTEHAVKVKAVEALRDAVFAEQHFPIGDK